MGWSVGVVIIRMWGGVLYVDVSWSMSMTYFLVCFLYNIMIIE